MIKIINKTDHVIALTIHDLWHTIMPTGLSCKLKYTKEDPYVSDGIRFCPKRVVGVIELPDSVPDTYIIVEREIALYIWKAYNRDDVCYLDYPIVRDDKYMSLAAMSLVCMSNTNISYCL